MSAKTGIQWTQRIWNPVRGILDDYLGTLNVRSFSAPLKWRGFGRVALGFDLFYETISESAIDRVFAVMGLAPRYTFQVLTKSPERMLNYCKTLGRHHSIDRVSLEAKKLNAKSGFTWSHGAGGWHLPNVWLGVSVENQEAADERIPHLLATPAALRFLSVEPLLGPVDLRFCVASSICYDRDPEEDSPVATLACPSGRHWVNQCEHVIHTCGVDWVIVGGESGPGARPCDLDWIRSIVKQCHAAGVNCFVDQLGRHPFDTNDLNPFMWLRDRKGGDPSEWPEGLRVREMPTAKGGA